MGLWRYKSTSVLVKDHAARRMMERGIFKSDILEVLNEGKEIEEYPNDFPYPSSLLFKIVDDRPIHIVAAFNRKENQIIIITTYIPDEDTFESDHITRKKGKQ
jgi:hypothetical protein